MKGGNAKNSTRRTTGTKAASPEIGAPTVRYGNSVKGRVNIKPNPPQQKGKMKY